MSAGRQLSELGTRTAREVAATTAARLLTVKAGKYAQRTPDVHDVVYLAEWLLTGQLRDPWPDTISEALSDDAVNAVTNELVRLAKAQGDRYATAEGFRPVALSVLRSAWTATA